VLVTARSRVLEAPLAMSSVDVEATRSEGLVVASVEERGEDVALTWADASRISNMLTNARAKRTRRPIPENAMMFVFIFLFL
jgi:hypothetical protein